MFSALGKRGLRILRHMSPASTKGPWTMKFIFSQLHLSTVSFLKALNVCMCAWGSSVWPGIEPILLCAFGCHPNTTGKDHTLRRLTSLSLSFSFSRCVFQRSPRPPTLTLTPPCPVYFLLSALIALADIRTGKRQCNVAALTATLGWINTCTGSTDCTPLT